MGTGGEHTPARLATPAQLATAAAAALRTAGYPVHHCELGQLTPDLLGVRSALCFWSPPMARVMRPIRHCVSRTSSLGSAILAESALWVLALGDSGYSRFCAFGRHLDAWLSACGAQSLCLPASKSIAAIRSDCAAGSPDSIVGERQSFGFRGGFTAVEDCCALASQPGQSGWAVFHLALLPGDDGRCSTGNPVILVRVEAPAAASSRLYTIASLPAQGALSVAGARTPRRPGFTLVVPG
jgi:sulfite reductase (NADPH) flavoprotein alpha-component